MNNTAESPPRWSDATRGRVGFGLMLAAVAVALATQFSIRQEAGFERIGLGFLAAVLLIHAGITLMPKTDGRLPKLQIRTELVLIIGIIGIATFLRVWRIWDFPPGIYFDETNNWRDALDIIKDDHFKLWSPLSSGRPTLYVYLLAVIFWVFGASEMALRALPIAIGVITVGAFYLLARHLLGQIPGLAATFLLAVSRWQINFSRISWEAALMPLMVTLSLFFLFKALETKRWYYFGATGVVLGAGLYTYLAFRFVPVFVGLLVAYIAWREWPLIRENLVRLTAAALISVIVFLPLGLFAFTHQDDFFNRATQVDVRTEIEEAGDLGPLWTNTKAVANMFNVHSGDNGRHNYDRRPILDEISAAMLVLGAGASLAAWRNWRKGFMLPLALLLAVPSVITVMSENPSEIRTLGMVPLLFLMVGLVFKEVYEAAFRWINRWWLLIPVSALLLAASGTINYVDYFEGHLKDEEAFIAFESDLTIVAERVVEEAGTAQLIVSGSHSLSTPMNLLAQDVPRTIYDPSLHLPAPEASESLLYILDLEDGHDLSALQLYYPDGEAEVVLNPFGSPMYSTFRLSPEARSSTAGLRSRTFSGSATSGPPIATDVLAEASIDWEAVTPHALPLTVVWDGSFLADSYRSFTFEIVSPGAIRLEIDDLVLAEGEDLITVETGVPLAVGPHSLRVTLSIERLQGVSELRWLIPGAQTSTLVPQEALLNRDLGDVGFLVRYYSGPDVTAQPAIVARQLHLGPQARLPGLYSAELLGQIEIQSTGSYGFALTTSEQATVFLDGEMVLNLGSVLNQRAEQRVDLSAGWHDLVVRYQGGNGRADWLLEWARQDEPWTAIPIDILRPPASELSGLQAASSVVALLPDPAWGEDGRSLRGVASVRGLALGPDGSLYILDFVGNVHVFDTNGMPLRDWSTELEEPQDIAVDTQGNVYVVDKSTLIRYSDGATIGQVLNVHSNSTVGIDVATDGTVYIAQANSSAISILDATGNLTRRFRPDTAPNGHPFLQPTDIVLTPDNTILVVTLEEATIWAFGAQGEYLLHWPFQSSRIWNAPHLAWYDGLVYATDPEGARVLAYEPDGKLRARGHVPRSSNELAKPVAIAAGDGAVWTADAPTGRVFRFLTSESSSTEP